MIVCATGNPSAQLAGRASNAATSAFDVIRELLDIGQ
jgi:hypothetical protein